MMLQALMHLIQLLKKNFFASKGEAGKLDINKVVNVPTRLNNLKTKGDDLDVGKLKTVPVDMKKLNHVVDDEIVKNTKFNTLNAKVINIEKKIPDATALIHINQYNTDKQTLEKKIGDVDKKNARYKQFSDYNCFEYKNQ